MTWREKLLFGAGAIVGLTTGLAAWANAAPPMPPSVEVTLHRFNRVPGADAKFREWIDFLHAHHREAVATLGRERTYFEAMFTAPDEPSRLYWITVQGTGGASVESSTMDMDRKHIAYMAAVLAKGTHRRLTTQNVLAPDFIVNAVRREQAH